jgi:hypothetical protein
VIEILVEEPSAEAFLEVLVPKVLPNAGEVGIRVFNGKPDLLRKLPDRLKAYRTYPKHPKVLVLVDRDEDDCKALKQRLELIASDVGLRTKTNSPANFTVCNRIACEELEAWMLGDEQAVRSAFPGVAPFANKAKFRDPDSVAGGTAEALERLLQRARHYPSGLAKVDCARRVAPLMDLSVNRSSSFNAFVDGLRSL